MIRFIGTFRPNFLLDNFIYVPSRINSFFSSNNLTRPRARASELCARNRIEVSARHGRQASPHGGGPVRSCPFSVKLVVEERTHRHELLINTNISPSRKMNSPKSFKSSPIAVPKISDPSRQIRAHSDPNIFKNDRVLRTLISREMKHASGAGERSTVQTEVKPGMRLEVANWMLGNKTNKAVKNMLQSNHSIAILHKYNWHN